MFGRGQTVEGWFWRYNSRGSACSGGAMSVSLGLTANVAWFIVQGFLLRSSSCSVAWIVPRGLAGQAECTIPPLYTSGKHKR